MPDVEALLGPSSLEEALELMARHGERARALAGGTTVVLAKGTRQDVLVDLSRTGLDAIKVTPGGLRVGAMATCDAVRRALAGAPSALSDAAAAVGSRVLRNHVTVGGNCVMVYAWSDVPVAAWCVQARFELAARGGARRTLDADVFFAQHPTRVLGPGELLTAVLVPAARPGTGSAFLKLARNEGDHASASAAALVEMDGEVVTRSRIVAGGVKGMPQVLAGAAAALAGRRPDAEVLAEVGRVAEGEAEAISDFRGGTEWRKHVVGALASDAVRAAVRRAR